MESLANIDLMYYINSMYVVLELTCRKYRYLNYIMFKPPFFFS